ncbi:nitroreductase family protein [Urechidicola vernalis]|uniref:Nitroreductase family protein n=1 Tax=Urechidicola vernalis TaxID=3075600 RepID=A0ABU2Y7K6_9FLAO|nr:nitroreductase family protein [Urechidicola sp. P050]MDT0553811.1 nitroreductase family protein [Urechidicola sp. P050]
MDSIEKLKWRYATKKFNRDKKLSNEQLDVLKNAFNLTATSYGLQPLKLLVISNQEVKDNLVEYAFNQSQVADCSHLLVICIKTDIDSNYVDRKFNLEIKERGLEPEMLSDFRAYLKKTIENQSQEDKDNAAKNQAYIALGNLMTVCALEEIDSCPMEGFLPSKFDKALNLKDENLKSVLLLPVGFRAEDDFMSSLKKVRLPIEESIITID